MKQAQMILLAAPSGAGKNSFLNRALGDFPLLQEVVTYTTRKPRHQETPGEDYHFLSPSAFKAKIGEGFFAEWSMVHDCFYGTSHESLQQVWDQGHVAIMDIDVQGVEKMKKLYPQAMSLFILPPSMEELKRRILLRDQQAPENLELRLQNAQKEMEQAHGFDAQIINDDFEEAYGQFKKKLAEWLSF